MNKKKLLLILISIFNISSIILLIKLIQLDKLITILLLIVELLITFILLRKKTKKISKILVSILCIILSFTYIVIDYSLIHTTNVIDKVTTNKEEYKTYNILVLKTSKYKKINNIKNKKIGFIETDVLLENNTQKLKKEIKYQALKYKDINEMITALNQKEIDAISIEESIIDLLEEADINIKKETKVIYTYQVKAKNNKVIKTDTDTKEPFILYISGTDSRTGINGIARSDVNIVVTINPITRKILLISIPRDYYVQLHDTTGIKDKLTHAGVYGINKSITTIEDLLEIKIDRYVKVSFDTVEKTVDLVDGIDIESDIDFTTWMSKKCKFHTGVQHVNGFCALAFARERKAYATGDRHRGENQEQVITKTLEKLSTPKYLLKYNQLLDITKDTFHTNMTKEEILKIVEDEYNATTKWQVETYNLDGSGAMLPTYSMGSMNLWVMIPNEGTITTAKEKINDYLNK